MECTDRPVERLLAMFATDRRKSAGGAARRRNNGATRFAELSGIQPAEVSRWRHGGPRGPSGEVPPLYNDRVILACDRAGIPRTALIGILKPATCPKCGQLIEGTTPPLGGA